MKYIPLSQKPRAVILDTDIGPDCDDVGALALLVSYAKEYGFPILGVCNCTSNAAGTGTVDAILRFCHYPVPLLAQWDRPGFMDGADCCKYNTYIASRFSADYANGTLQAESPVSFYRRLLANAEDHAVTIISIGMFNCLAALLQSEADAYSPLSGKELVQKKVDSMVSMAALLPQGREFNIICDPDAARTVFAEWPTPIYLSHFEIGFSFKTGFSGISEEPEMQNNPIYKSYELYTNGICQNCSFDLTAVQFAVLGEDKLYHVDAPGRLDFYKELPSTCDATIFVPDTNGFIYPIQKTAGDSILREEINRRIRAFS